MKKREIKNYFKLGILIIGISFFITNCQKDDTDSVEQLEVVKSNLSIKYVSSEKIPNIINLLNPNNRSSSKSSMVSTAFGNIAIENVLEVIDTLGNQNYSFILTPKNPKPNSIFNLVVNSSSGIINMAIVEYRMAPSFAQDYYKGLKTISEFTGSIFKFPYSSSSNLFTKSSETCIQNIDEVVNCDQINVDNGNMISLPSGGGTQGTTSLYDTTTYTGGDGGNVTHNYSGGGSVSWECNDDGTTQWSPAQCNAAGHGGAWVITLPYNHTNRYSYTKKTENCCDKTNLDGSIGVNLLTKEEFLDQIVIDQNFKDNPCLKKVYEDMGKAASIKNYLQNFDPNFTNPIANLRLTVGVHPDHPDATAVTNEPNNYIITITFNPNKLNRPKLDVARTMIHEIIHAEMYRKLLEVARQPNIPWTEEFIHTLRNNYEGLADYYTRHWLELPLHQQPRDPQHELMAEHFIGIISKALKNVDNSLTDQQYRAIAWTGLKGTGGELDANTGLPPNPTIAWSLVPLSERLLINSAYKDFSTSNSNCQ
jgi:hypothetical protein